MKLRAADVMTRGVQPARPDWPVEHLAEFLVEHGFTGAPVVDEDGRLCGVVSMTDIARNACAPVRQGEATHDYFVPGHDVSVTIADLAGLRVQSLSGVTVRDIMTGTVFEVDETTPVTEVADAMLRGRIHRLFVTKDGELTGIISALDLLRLVRDG